VARPGDEGAREQAMLRVERVRLPGGHHEGHVEAAVLQVLGSTLRVLALEPRIAAAGSEEHRRACERRSGSDLLVYATDGRPGERDQRAQSLPTTEEKLDRQARALREPVQHHVAGADRSHGAVQHRPRDGER
jgi:hypothetical protein